MNDKIGPADTVRAECLDALNRSGLSRTAAARKIGISGAAFSRWLSGQYEGDNARLDQLVATWLATMAERERHSTSAAGLDVHCDLLVTREIEAALAHAQAVGDIVLVHGLSGAGKSWAGRHYADTRAATYYLQCTRAMRTMSALLGRVAEACGAWVKTPSAMAYESAIIEQLKGRGALLVIDEAHHLPASLLDELRCIRDVAGCGLALVASDEIRMTLARCPQIVGRIGIRLEKKVPARVDVDRIVSVVLGREATEKEVNAAMAAAAAPGGLHTLRRMLERAWVTARASGRKSIDREDIVTAGLAVSDSADRIVGGKREAA